MQPTKVYASFFHFSAKSREVFLLVNCARIRRGPSVTYISGSAPRICSSNACVVKFVAHQLHMVIKGEYLLILFPFFLSCFLSFIFSHFQIHLKTFFFFKQLFLKTTLLKSPSAQVKSRRVPCHPLS